MKGNLVTKRYILKYLSPEEAEDYLRDNLSEYGSITFVKSEEIEPEKEEEYIVIPYDDSGPSSLEKENSSSKNNQPGNQQAKVVYVTDLERNIAQIDEVMKELNGTAVASEETSQSFYVKEGSLQAVALAVANVIGVSPENIEGLKAEELQWMKMQLISPTFNLGNIGEVGKK